MSSFPNTSFHLKNEHCRLSLLENEEDATITDTLIPKHKYTGNVGKCDGEKVHHDIYAPIWKPKISPPPVNRPPHEPWRPIRNSLHFLVSTFLTLLFYVCLPVSVALYIFLGFIPWLFVKLILRCSDGGRFQLVPVNRAHGGSASGNAHTVMLVCRGRCDIEKIRGYMYDVVTDKDSSSGTGKFVHLQKRVATKFGYLCYENRTSSFDIKNHVRHFDIRSKNIPVDADEIIAYMESTYNQPFDNHLTSPQWEILLVPKYNMRRKERELIVRTGEKKKFYALVIRFHSGIMDWNMLQEILVDFMGKTNGRVSSIFCPNEKHTNFWKNLKIIAACPLTGPQSFLRKIFQHWKIFANLKPVRDHSARISFAATKPIPAETLEDITDRTQTGIASVLATCVRMAVRNLALGQNMDFPASLTIARSINTMRNQLPGVDSFSTNFQKYRSCLERLHASFHSVEKGEVSLRGQQTFNKMMILLAGTFPCKVSAWLYKTLMKADVVVEICPGTEEPCKILGGDTLEDIYGWCGSTGINANFKVTITSYCGRIRANVIGKLGKFSGGLTDAQVIANELQVEYEHLASAVGVYPKQLYLSPVIAD